MSMQTPQPEATSEQIAEALGLLDGLADSDVADHPGVYEQVHRVLRDELAGRSDGGV